MSTCLCISTHVFARGHSCMHVSGSASLIKRTSETSRPCRCTRTMLTMARENDTDDWNGGSTYMEFIRFHQLANLSTTVVALSLSLSLPLRLCLAIKMCVCVCLRVCVCVCVYMSVSKPRIARIRRRLMPTVNRRLIMAHLVSDARPAVKRSQRQTSTLIMRRLPTLSGMMSATGLR